MAKRPSDQTTRSDKIRAKRQESQKQIPNKNIGTNTTRKKPVNAVPVTHRRTTQVPMVKRPQNKVPVRLRSKGAELQLPAMPRFSFGWRLFSGAIFAISLIMIISFLGLSTFKVNAINLEGAQRLNPEEISTQIDSIGRSIITVKPDEIEAQILENIPSLKSASVSIGLPANVNIKVVERVPVILWQHEDSTLWIDSEGISFPVTGELESTVTVVANSSPPPAPMVEEEGSPEEENISPTSLLYQLDYPKTTLEFVKGILALSPYVPEGSALQYDPKFGLGWQDPQGWMVYFGMDAANIDIKLAEYQTIIATLQKENITPAMISLEFLHAPYYRME
jgi:cell division protein FtsQ